MKVHIKFIKALGVLLVAALLFAVLPVGEVKADTLFVGPGQTHTTIQEAIDAASDGDTIQVAAGIYAEDISVTGKNFNLIGTVDGEGNPISIIKGSLDINNNAITTELTTTIENIYFDGVSKHLLTLKKFNGGLIKNCVFDGNDQFIETPSINGIQLTNPNESITVKDSTFKDGLYVSIGGYVNGLIVDNSKFTNVKSGINLIGGGNLAITNSYFKNKPVTDTDSYGIRYTAGGGKSLSVTNSTFEIDLSEGLKPEVGEYHTSIYLRGSGADTVNITGNKIYGGAVNTSSISTLDASYNWWGSPCGPSNITDGITYAPWYADEAMKIERSGNVSGEYTFPSGTSHDEINAVVACAAPGSTLIFGGEYEASIWVYEDREDLTFLLKDGTVLQGYEEKGYLFYVDADYIKILGESYGGAKLVPINGWHAVNVGCAGSVLDFILDGVEIDGAYLEGQRSGIGVYFGNFGVEDVQILNNYIHDLSLDDEISAAMTLESDIAGTFDVQGNLFQNVGPIETAEVYGKYDTKYNSWGSYDVEGSQVFSDDVGYGVEFLFEPWTHVELFVEYVEDSTPWVDQVVSDDTMEVTYAVKADMVEITGAEFMLLIPDDLTITDIAEEKVFDWQSITQVNGGIFYAGAQFGGTGYAPGDPIEGKDIVLFTVTLKTDKPGEYTLEVDETTDEFAMRPVDGGVPGGPSTWVYLDEAHPATLNAIALPTITIVPVAGQSYIAGTPIEFNVEITNTNGGYYADVGLEFESGGYIEYYDADSGTWKVYPGVEKLGSLYPNGTNLDPDLPLYRVTFLETGVGEIHLTMLDRPAVDDVWLADTHISFDLLGNFTVTGTFSMQGRTPRAGILVTLDNQDLLPGYQTPLFGSLSGTTINQISHNLVVTNVNGGHWLLTTLQQRYLNVIAENQKIILVDGDKTLTSLELKGGNAYWINDDGTLDNEIDIGDAGLVGGAYGQPGSTTPTGANHPDVNFDGKVNIQDLALVGGNFGLTSQDAYALWVPSASPWNGVYPAAAPGSLKDPVDGVQEIHTAEEFAWILSQADMFPTGTTTVKLMTDINLNNFSWTPSGGLASGSAVTGDIFDGNGHTIYNLNVTREGNAALFVGNNPARPVVQNLVIDGAYIEAKQTETSRRANAAVLAIGIDGGTSFTNVTVRNATIKGTKYVAVISGYSSGIVGDGGYFTDCTVENATIEVQEVLRDNNVDFDLPHIGAIVGLMNKGTFTGNKVTNLTIIVHPVDGESVHLGQVGALIGTAQPGVYPKDPDFANVNTISSVTCNGDPFTKLIGLDQR